MAEFDNVSFSFGNRNILQGFSLRLENGESTCIFGHSGEGKTTLLSLMAGFLIPSSGSITADGKVSVLFQEDRLLPWETALGNLVAVGINYDDAEKFMAEAGLSGCGDRYPDELSGGMKRRLAIIRTLAYGGDIFLLDEPLQGLDLKSSDDILSLIKREIAGKTSLIISHSPKEAFCLADRIITVRGNPLEITSDRRKNEFESAERLSEFVMSNI